MMGLWGEKTTWSSEEWLDYFRINARSLLDIPWDRGAELSEAEREAIAASVQGFQLGESSEGRHLYNCAKNYAVKQDDPAYRDVIRLFIGEEQRHARELGRFLRLAGIPLLGRHWTDTIFRWLRHRAGLETAIIVVLTPELIAMVYYAALRAATGSAVLRRICEQILIDEVEHIRFQSERLAILRSGRARWRIACLHGWQRLLFWGTCWVVWWKHGRALRAGGFGLHRFWRSAWHELNAALVQMDPRHYTARKCKPQASVPVG